MIRESFVTLGERSYKHKPTMTIQQDLQRWIDSKDQSDEKMSEFIDSVCVDDQLDLAKLAKEAGFDKLSEKLIESFEACLNVVCDSLATSQLLPSPDSKGVDSKDADKSQTDQPVRSEPPTPLAKVSSSFAPAQSTDTVSSDASTDTPLTAIETDSKRSGASEPVLESVSEPAAPSIATGTPVADSIEEKVEKKMDNKVQEDGFVQESKIDSPRPSIKIPACTVNKVKPHQPPCSVGNIKVKIDQPGVQFYPASSIGTYPGSSSQPCPCASHGKPRTWRDCPVMKVAAVSGVILGIGTLIGFGIIRSRRRIGGS